MRPRIRELLTRLTGARPKALQLQVQPLLGGLVSASVCAVTVRYGDRRGQTHTSHWVVKQLEGRARREAAIYEALRQIGAGAIAPSVIAVQSGEAGELQLVLEHIVPSQHWPWKDTAAAASVLRALACLHGSTCLHGSSGRALAASVADWNYEAELQERAAQLLQALESGRELLQSAGLDLRLPVVRRLIRHLPEWRKELLSSSPLGQSVIHGDAHPGNVRMRQSAAQLLPVLFDWERARLGSPLEDVSSWLQTLAFWEPEARRRHDTLLGEYLLARGFSARPTRALRDMYWLAAASNCLSGSLAYHVAVATDRGAAPQPRLAALGAVRDQVRILRRADACWSCGGAAR